MVDLHVLWDVWGEHSGYVFIPRAKRTPGVKRATAWEEGPAFSWPEDREAIAARVTLSVDEGWDVYWCPLIFAKPSRNKASAKDVQGWVYADLDLAKPSSVVPSTTTVWSSSKGKYQALWQLDTDYPTAKVEELARSIAYRYAKMGADKSGWDIGQVLRVPGTLNHKYDPPSEVKLISHGVTRAYDVYAFPPAPGADPADDRSSDGLDGSIDTTAKLEDLLTPYKLSSRATLLAYAKTPMGDRSERLWELAKLLVEAGLPVKLVAQVLKLTVWNKYRGRADEDKRLMTDALKAEAEYRSKAAEPLPAPVADRREWPVPYGRFMASRPATPSWMVDGILPAESYGLVVGEPKTYKSVMITDLALSVASGAPFLGVFPVLTTGAVMYVQEENHEATVYDRVVKIAKQKGLIPNGAWEIPADLPFYLSNNMGIDLTDEGHREQLQSAVEQLNIKLLILDPLYMMLGQVDENNSKELRPVLQFLTGLRNKFGCGAIIIHHFKKAQIGSPRMRGGQRTRGSSILHGWTECSMYADLMPDGIRIEREFRSFPKQPDLKIAITMGNPGTDLYEPEVLTDEGGTTAADIKREELLSILADRKHDGISFDDLKSLLKVVRPKLQTWLRELKDEGWIETFKKGRGTFYRLSRDGKEKETERKESESI